MLFYMVKYVYVQNSSEQRHEVKITIIIAEYLFLKERS